MNYIVYIFVLIVGIVSSNLSMKGRNKLGKLFAYILYKISKKRWLIAYNNVKNAFPEEDDKFWKRISKEAYQNLGITMIELIAFKNSNKDLLNNIVRFVNSEVVINELEEGKSVILLSGHIGNWELGPYVFAEKFKYPIDIIGKKQANPYLNKLINRNREYSGNKIVEMDNAAKRMIMTLRKKNGIVAMLVDQSARGEKDILHPVFFGKPAATYATPAYLALKFKLSLIFADTIRQKDGTYKIEFHKIKTDDLIFDKESIRILTERHVKLLEDVIRKYPGQWSWMHRRWKR